MAEDCCLSEIVTVDKIVQQGVGLGRRLGGGVFYVPYTAPGDRVEVEVIDERKKEAKLKKILEPSSARAEPFCPYFYRCGGCQFQHILYEPQLKIKESLLLDALRRFGNISLDRVDLVPSLPRNYRVRVRLKKSPDGLQLGYFEAHSRKLVPISVCPIATPEISEFIQVYLCTAEIRDPLRSFPEIEISALPGQRRVVVSDGKKNAFFDLDKKQFDGTKPMFLVPHIQNTFTYATGTSFIQANFEVNRKMVKTACDLLADCRQSILELYSGNGNFTIPLSRGVKQVYAIETNSEAVRLGKQGAEEQGFRNIEFMNRGVLAGLTELRRGFFEAVLLDPPREGATSAVIEVILQFSPQKILYISCNPLRLAQELRQIFKSKRYRLTKAILFDQFPQTVHIETMVLLEKNNS